MDMVILTRLRSGHKALLKEHAHLLDVAADPFLPLCILKTTQRALVMNLGRALH